MDAFLLKKIVSNLVHLVPGVFLALLLACLLQRWWPRCARIFILVLTLGLLALSSAPVSNTLVAKLENQNPVLQSPPPKTSHILVLGSGHDNTSSKPANSVLSATALSRLTEGVRLWKSQPTSKLVTSGAKFRSDISHADAMAAMAIELGVPQDAIVRLNESRDTSEEIRAAKKLMSANDLLVIVSSATHLPRAGLLARQYQVPYLLAPTDFLQIDAPWYRLDGHFLRNVDRAVHEWVGMLWQVVNQKA